MAKGKVCVTGASGFLASWLVKRLLLSGYHVTGTVRDPGNERKVGHLLKLEGAKERLRLVKADLMHEGSFDEAIMGCQGVFHTASPVIFHDTPDPKADMVEPALKGTLNVLSSCKKNPSLKRVIFTSSATTLGAGNVEDTCWADAQHLEEQQSWYDLSKVLAEKAAWDFCNENGIDLVTIIPSFVIGPYLCSDLPSTAPFVLAMLQGETEILEQIGRVDLVHIDDVALSHILLYETQKASGRYICSAPVMDGIQLISLFHKRYPNYPSPPSSEEPKKTHPEYNTGRLRSLGFKFRPVEDMFDDLIKSLKEQGRDVSLP